MIYIYSIRRARINNKPQYIGLIPKLFGNLYTMNKDKQEQFLESELKSYESEDQTTIFANLLNSDDNYIKKNTYIDKKKIYIDKKDQEIIINLNKELFKKMEPEMFDKFIEHLYRGHNNMKYGIYFSLAYADSDDEFLKNFKNLTDSETANQRILFYAPLKVLLEHVNNVDLKEHFSLKSPLLYINSHWNYGEYNKDTIKMTRTEGNLLNQEKFIKDILDKYKKNIDKTELICQLPLPENLFRTKFINISSANEFTNKYLKYKKKYLDLKNKINNHINGNKMHI